MAIGKNPPTNLPMKVTELALKDVLLLESQILQDNRGSFMELYHEQKLLGTPLEGKHYVQDNLSYSHKYVFRGMHAQHSPHAQGKLVRAIKGKLVDLVLDITPTSPTYRQALSIELTEGDGKALFVPGQYAHGMLSLAEDTALYYKVDNFFHPSAEIGISYREPAIEQIILQYAPLSQLIISEKDLRHPLLP